MLHGGADVAEGATHARAAIDSSVRDGTSTAVHILMRCNAMERGKGKETRVLALLHI